MLLRSLHGELLLVPRRTDGGKRKADLEAKCALGSWHQVSFAVAVWVKQRDRGVKGSQRLRRHPGDLAVVRVASSII